MKKKLTFMILLVLVSTMVCSSIAEDVQEEIRFNNIPWGISITEANEIMVSLGYKSYEPEETSIYIWPKYWWTNMGNSSVRVKDTGYNLGGAYNLNETTPKVGGYPIEWTYLHAYYDYNENGIDKDPAKSHYCDAVMLFYVEYELADATYADLKRKLTKLYGEPTDKSSYNTLACEWYGANNTAVHLEEVINSKSKVVALVYGFTNIEDTLLQVREMVVKSIPLADENDLGGL